MGLIHPPHRLMRRAAAAGRWPMPMASVSRPVIVIRSLWARMVQVARRTGAQARLTARPVAQTVGRVGKTVALVGRWRTAPAGAAVWAGRQIMDTRKATLTLATRALAAEAQVDIAALVVTVGTINQRPLRRREQAERLALVERVVAVAEGLERITPLNSITYMEVITAVAAAGRGLKERARQESAVQAVLTMGGMLAAVLAGHRVQRHPVPPTQLVEPMEAAREVGFLAMLGFHMVTLTALEYISGIQQFKATGALFVSCGAQVDPILLTQRTYNI